MEVKFYESIDDSLLKFAVIISQYKGKLVFCKHRQRNTLEIPGGHREKDEKIEETKELYLKEHVTHESIDIRLNDEKNVIQNDVCDKTNISEEDDGLNIPFSNERDSL